MARAARTILFAWALVCSMKGNEVPGRARRGRHEAYLSRRPMGDSGPVMDVDRHARERAQGNGAAGARPIVAPMFALSAVLLLGAAAPPRQASVAYVIDGDTFRLASGERTRIAGIDAPETQPGHAKCGREIAAGRAATTTARGLLQGRTVRLGRLGRSYSRTVARVTLDGRDVAGELVRLGAARWWPRGQRKPDWCHG